MKQHVAVLAIVLWIASAAAAANYDISLFLPAPPYLNEHDVPAVGAFAGGPASAANSMLYLEGRYPGVYGGLLLSTAGSQYDKLLSTATTLTGESYMKTIVYNWTWHDDFIWGKTAYIEERVPSKTTYSAQDSWPWSNSARPKLNWVTNTNPNWEFIAAALTDGASMEALLSWNASSGHYVTLTGFHWNDANFDGIIEPYEYATIDIIEPYSGSLLAGTYHLWEDFSGGMPRLATDYNQDSPWLSMVMAAGPTNVPEPSTIALGISGTIALAFRRMRSGRKESKR
jgi:hypothetical protein